MSFTLPVQASQVLTAAGVFTDTQTVVIGSKTYTTQTVLTNVDGNVAIGASAAVTLQNLFDAINLTGTPGTQYATLMTKHPTAYASAVTATTLTVKANNGGVEANVIATTETQTNASFGAATLAGGSGSMDSAIRSLLDTEQLNANVAQTLRELCSLAASS